MEFLINSTLIFNSMESKLTLVWCSESHLKFSRLKIYVDVSIVGDSGADKEGTVGASVDRIRECLLNQLIINVTTIAPVSRYRVTCRRQ